MKVVLDSNVLISAFATKGLCADLFRDIVSSHELLISEYILGEVSEKLIGKLKIPASTVQGIVNLLRRFVVCPSTEAKVDLRLRDPDDLPIVGFALAVGADVLITGDRDLLDAALELPVKVLSPKSFIQVGGSGSFNGS